MLTSNCGLHVVCFLVLATSISSAVLPPLQTKGDLVIDAAGQPVRFACVNWYGAHMERFVVNGLDKRPAKDIAEHIASLGFNCVRLVFSNDLYFHNPKVNASAVKANPSLAGATALHAFDVVVNALTSSGLMVILNNHISNAGWCCSEDDGNGLWYTKDYPTQKWQQMWVAFAKRYKSNSLVVAADLRNELRKAHGIAPTWGTGNATTDWKSAAQACGNMVLRENSNLLIIVEGLQYANILHEVSNSNVTPQDDCLVCRHHIRLSVPHRLVYSGHLYDWDGYPTKEFESFERKFERYQTYVTSPGKPYTAPFWLGEFGTNTHSPYWKFLIRFLEKRPALGWAYWALDGYQHHGGADDDETFGIFAQDYKTIRHPWKVKDLQKLQGIGMQVVV